ncbi:MAG: protein kinase domain-containing protein [Anaerolineaceae bacterium]
MIPAENLLGLKLNNKWNVIKYLEKQPHSTGGHFSRSYIVKSDQGFLAFLKAIDYYSEALSSEDSLTQLNILTQTFLFERQVLQKCTESSNDRIVRAIEDGQYRFQSGEVVPFFVFELADGDVRSQVLLNTSFDLALKLRALHHIATGLQQIHRHNIAHQDLKPSNVLVFPDRISKIADFGSASYKGYFPPHENYMIPGDWGYAPPEQLYGQIDPDWIVRRFGCDLYHLGSMVTFFFLGVQMTALLKEEIPNDKWFRNWGGTYEEILPYIRNAFYIVLEKLKSSLPDDLKVELVNVVLQLCEPDPHKRGNITVNNASSQYSVDVYISKFDRLAKRAELKLIVM